MSDEILRVENICKSFSTVEVLHNVSFGINRGEVLGLIGENGAGKSTMMKILSGIYEPTTGDIYFEGKPIVVGNTASAKKIGISIIPQEFNLINDLTVSDNVFLGSEIRKKSGFLDKDAMKKKTGVLLKSLEVEISPDEKIENLSGAEKQMVEISKALAFESKVLIMDEPTSVLTSHEINILFKLMKKLKEKGLTIVYISHKLKEVKEICDRVLVLRDGNFVLDANIESISPEEMAQSMVGRELSQIFPPKVQPESEVVFKVENICVDGLVRGVSFDLRKGEILGLGGLVGAGRTEVSEAIMGLRKMSEGKVVLNGETLQIRHPEDAVKAGLGYLSEDRQGSGIITSFSVARNTTLVSLPRYSNNSLRWIDKARELKSSEKYKNLFNLKTTSLHTALEFLSGGNQQKVSMSKSIDTEPLVLIVDEPTRGIDVSAKQEIYYFINNLVKEGISCIFISSEMEELIGMCHRVVVMKDGEVTGVLEGEKISEESIMLYATGIIEGEA
ncbi:sugar ABC transporter ATP-binding protein [Oceanispirochaeta crateris]|uniref:Sugar ABC transporter ATP-binding protein n=1 Tax=Oceanispirochaeta crateris TaxID=2518645 RepID=A0A5C1QIZ2_9SPIO|nr:sugar ABC transporter ATP-binding protein [Oceanispirochaeta crateris]QEN08123.1 sugar ABC transporter ATP-binding protein [Oceanispirochaeta crateris]